MAELKKCPFCGSGVAKIKVGSPFMWEHAIVCVDCGASTKLMGGITLSNARDRAIKAWNNRATEAEIRNKAISELLEKTEKNTADFVGANGYLTGADFRRILHETAEQLRRNEE